MPNKEIKFRAWDKIEKQMILNPIITDIDNATNYIGLNDLWNKFEENGLIIQQYTGLKDKNGKEIYGGDIIVNKRGAKRIVYWNEKGQWYSKSTKSKEFLDVSLDEVMNYESKDVCFVEIIGNIYENPNLLT